MQEKLNTRSKSIQWSSKEHARFLDGLEKFGKDWDKVCENVRTKTRK